MKHITKKRVSRGRKRGQVRTQARPRKRASVTRHRKKNKSRRGLYTKKRKVMAGGVKPDGWDNWEYSKRYTHAIISENWKRLDDEFKIQFINEIPNDRSLQITLDLVTYSANSQQVKDAIANRRSLAGRAVAPEHSQVSPFLPATPLQNSRTARQPLPDFSIVALNAQRKGDLTRHPSSDVELQRESSGENPFQPHPFQPTAQPYLYPSESQRLVVSLPGSPRQYLESSERPSTPFILEKSESTLPHPNPSTSKLQPPPVSRQTLAAAHPIQPPPPSTPPPSSILLTQQPSESIQPPPPSTPPSNVENKHKTLDEPNLLGNLPPVEEVKEVYDIPITQELIKSLEKNKKTNNSDRKVICDCSQSSTPPPPPTRSPSSNMGRVRRFFSRSKPKK